MKNCTIEKKISSRIANRRNKNHIHKKEGKNEKFSFLGFNSEVQQMVPRIPQTELESQGIFLDGG